MLSTRVVGGGASFAPQYTHGKLEHERKSTNLSKATVKTSHSN
jgi:hypothetical protein